ncbi:MAG: ribosome small subunit-dependent GTPase A [Gammaproteobacteria bacterium]|nr:ribosome small subunit-dependent GTPase A [Gammaproteobacteria bacterium]
MNAHLTELGISPFYMQQLTLAELEQCHLARVTGVQRSGVTVNDGASESMLSLAGIWFKLDPEQRPTVGDWVLLNQSRQQIVRVLQRKSVFKRVAAGEKIEIQLIAANIDTLFIVSSCNEDFSESRLERYLAVAAEAQVDPVLVLTKADLVDEPDVYRQRARLISATLMIELVNALDRKSLSALQPWATPGSTVALVGSSGVGKSTIVNSFSGAQRTATQAIREQDAKGRHTTSSRSLHRLPGGGLLIDLPGMRELKVAELDSALEKVFDDIEMLAAGCRYNDCRHDQEPGCAVRLAIESGELDGRRLKNYQKLIEEESRNSASLAERRSIERKFGKVIKQHLAFKKDKKQF